MLVLIHGWAGLIGQTINYPVYNIDSIINITLIDTALYPANKELIKDYCKKLKENGNKIAFMFPYKPFSKVLLCKIDNENDTRLWDDPKDYWSKLDKKYLANSKTLNIVQIEKLLLIINNPLNFEWSECGSPIPEYEFVFTNRKGKIINRLVLCCNMNQIITKTDINIWGIMKWGDFHKGSSEFLKLIKQIEE